jgi:hypothetical protein
MDLPLRRSLDRGLFPAAGIFSQGLAALSAPF